MSSVKRGLTPLPDTHCHILQPAPHHPFFGKCIYSCFAMGSSHIGVPISGIDRLCG